MSLLTYSSNRCCLQEHWIVRVDERAIKLLQLFLWNKTVLHWVSFRMLWWCFHSRRHTWPRPPCRPRSPSGTQSSSPVQTLEKQPLLSTSNSRWRNLAPKLAQNKSNKNLLIWSYWKHVKNYNPLNYSEFQLFFLLHNSLLLKGILQN